MSGKNNNNTCIVRRWLRGKTLASTLFGVLIAQCVIASVPIFRRFGGVTFPAVVDVKTEPELSNVHHNNDHDDGGDDDSCQRFQTIHLVFSTGCSLSQNWQSYVFFYHAMLVGQQGDVTRIASGCTDEQQQMFAQRHQVEIVEKMSHRFHIHFTPDFSNIIEGQSYVYFNKPFGLRHWMDHVLGYPGGDGSGQQQQHNKKKMTKHDDTIIALLDPDMFLTKPLVNNFTDVATFPWFRSWYRPDLASRCVSHGKPVAQHYGFGDDWKASLGNHLVDVVGQGSPVLNVSSDDVEQLYAMGPPYLLTARDMYRIVQQWCVFAPRIHPFYPHLLAEMYGYSMSAAHVQLRHQLAYQMMISEPYKNFEGWQFLDNNITEPGTVCANDTMIAPPQTVVHYCQVYSVGTIVVTKYYIQQDFISCEAPLLWLPPEDLALRFTERIFTNGSMVPIEDLQQAVRISYIMCAVVKALNQAASYFKQNHCEASTETLPPFKAILQPNS